MIETYHFKITICQNSFEINVFYSHALIDESKTNYKFIPFKSTLLASTQQYVNIPLRIITIL